MLLEMSYQKRTFLPLFTVGHVQNMVWLKDSLIGSSLLATSNPERLQLQYSMCHFSKIYLIEFLKCFLIHNVVIAVSSPGSSSVHWRQLSTISWESSTPPISLLSTPLQHRFNTRRTTMTDTKHCETCCANLISFGIFLQHLSTETNLLKTPPPAPPTHKKGSPSSSASK